MREPTFNQEQPRSLLVPALAAVVLVALGLLVAWHFYRPGKVELTLVHTAILPTKTVFQSNSIVVGANEVNHTLFAVTTLRVENKRRYAVSLDNFMLTLTDPAGAQLTPTAVTRQDLPNLMVEFPKLKPMAGTPLVRDATIEPGMSVEGTVVFSMPISQGTWDARKSAEVKVDVYHLEPLYATIPK